jgi:hypothetical protein
LKPKTEKHWKRRIGDGLRKAYRWGDERIPPGVRLALGLVLIVGGVFGFLPILGFWMIPLGAVLVALDIPPLRRRLRRRLHPDGEDATTADD